MLRKLFRRLRAVLPARRADTWAPQERWNRSWSAPDYVPGWEARQIPTVLREAVESGWLPPRGSLLDIGCGAGDIAAWLAGTGYRVTAVDFAASAIARASARHQAPELRYAVTDICQAWPDPDVYDCLFDRGCLHGIPDADVEQYVANVAASSRAGGRFLLLFKTPRNQERSAAQSPAYALEARLAALQGSFAIERRREIDMLTGDEIGRETTYPGFALWLVRR